MNFIYNPKQIDKQISEIKKRFRKSMNGEVSQTMSSMGANYKVNYGIEYPRLKQIANHYKPSKDLAERLWAINIRETMILATLLHPIEDFTIKIAHNWIETINQPEQVEYLTMNILSKVKYAKEIALESIKSNKTWTRIIGFTLSARIYNQFDSHEVDNIIKTIEKDSETEDFHIYKSMALSLSKLCRINKNTTEKIRKIIPDLEQSNSISKKYIATTVKSEIIFLDF